MIIYNPLDGLALTSFIPSKPRYCFLMTRLGKPISAEVIQMRASITTICEEYGYTVIDASTEVTGRDYLLKIWKQIAATPPYQLGSVMQIYLYRHRPIFIMSLALHKHLEKKPLSSSQSQQMYQAILFGRNTSNLMICLNKIFQNT